jgi:hypothetical protein
MNDGVGLMIATQYHYLLHSSKQYTRANSNANGHGLSISTSLTAPEFEWSPVSCFVALSSN